MALGYIQGIWKGPSGITHYDDRVELKFQNGSTESLDSDDLEKRLLMYTLFCSEKDKENLLYMLEKKNRK